MTETERFFSRVKYSDQCWTWTGNIGTTGYGNFPSQGKTVKAHRWSYAYFVGPITKPEICHHCDNKLCINPFHLFNGTRFENMADMTDKGRHGNQKKTHCKHGHLLSGVNLKMIKCGEKRVRDCIVCRKRARQKSDKKRRAKAECGIEPEEG